MENFGLKILEPSIVGFKAYFDVLDRLVWLTSVTDVQIRS